MKLNNPIIDSFEFEGKEYNLNLSFDNVLDVFDILKDNTLPELIKIALGLSFFIDIDIPDDNDNVIEFISKELSGVDIIEMWAYIFEEFIVGKNEEKIVYDRAGNVMEVPAKAKGGNFIDLDKDADYIFSSFMQAYKINLLREQGSYSWQEFKALLNGLPEETIIKQIVRIRAWKPGKGTTNEESIKMRELQMEYSLEEME